MLKYIEILRNLTLDEKIKALFSITVDGNDHMENYELPLFAIKKGSFIENIEYPMFFSLAQTWNKELMGKIFQTYACRVAQLKSNYIVTCSMERNNPNTFSSDHYLNSSLSSTFINALDKQHIPCGISDIGQLSSDLESDRMNILMDVERSLKDSNPFVLHQMGPSLTSFIVKDFNYKGFLLFSTNDNAEALRGFYNKNHLAINSLSDMEKVLKEGISAYKNAQLDLNQNYITEGQFAEMERLGKIFNPARIDELLDGQLDQLSKFDYLMNHEEESCELTDNDEKNNLEAAAYESIVLIKNNNVLPILPNDKVALIGDACYKDANNKERGLTPLKAAKNTDIAYVGVAHGYVLSSDTTEDFLVKESIELAKKANVAVVFLKTKDVKDKVLPESEITLLEELKNNNIKVIAVVEAGPGLDYSFEQYCDAIIYIGYMFDKTYKAVFDVISGNYSPCGKLTSDIYHIVDEKTYVYHHTGYGLGYVNVEYSNIEVKPNQVSFVMHNVGTSVAHEVPMLYIRKIKDEGVYKNPQLRGFKRVDLYPNEATKVIIPFDKYTFRFYNDKVESYGIKGGTYSVSICSNSEHIELTQGIDLDEVYEKNVIQNETLTESNEVNATLDSFSEYADKVKLYKQELKKKQTKINLGLIVAYIYLLFTEAYTCLVYFTNTNAMYIIAGVLTLILLISLIVVGTKYKKKRVKLDNLLKPSDEESEFVQNVVNNTTPFVEEDHVVYALPDEDLVEAHPDVFEEVQPTVQPQQVAPQVVQPQPVIQQVTQPESEEPVVERVQGVPVQLIEREEHEDATVEELRNASSASFAMEETMNDEFVANTQALQALQGVDVTDRAVFSNKSLVQEIVLKFSNFIQSRGIMLDPRTTRAFISMLFSNKLIFLKSDDAELFKDFIDVLNEFLGNDTYRLTVTDKLKSFKDLIWYEDASGRCSPSDFTNFLFKVKKLDNHLNICFIDNCDVRSLAKYFSPFLSFCKAPMLGRTINLGSNKEPLYYTLPENLVFIINPNKDNFLEELPHGIAEISVSMNISPKRNEVQMDKFEYCLSYPVIQSMMHDANEANFLTEEFWKRIDEFEEGIVQFDPEFRIENKTVLMIEAFAAVIMENGADNLEIADDIFMYHIVPLMKSSKLYYAQNGDQEIANILKKIYADELTGAVRLIKKPMVVEG